MYRLLIVMVCLICASPLAAHESTIYPGADDHTVKLAGYTRLSTEIPGAQKELLSAVVEHRFGVDVFNVEQALKQVLSGSGFTLAAPSSVDPNLYILLQSGFPKIQRHIGPARIDAILEAIAGPAWELVVDPLHRLISFELKREYWPCGSQPTSNNSECGS
ncbi:MAG: hypothetical protein L3J62_10025 [Gammaproteobacteria bacterium]|nr:hypothetical protein [Gammaproteobacteria bacterium]